MEALFPRPKPPRDPLRPSGLNHAPHSQVELLLMDLVFVAWLALGF